MEQTKKKMLKVLCFHGFNNSKEVFEYQFRNFKQVFGSVMDFTVLDGPLDCADEPIGSLLKMGYKAPFKQWFRVNDYKSNLTEITEEKAFRATFNLEESVDYVVNEIKTNGPYDGILSFS